MGESQRIAILKRQPQAVRTAGGVANEYSVISWSRGGAHPWLPRPTRSPGGPPRRASGGAARLARDNKMRREGGIEFKQ
jgi:hypothetical protein